MPYSDEGKRDSLIKHSQAMGKVKGPQPRMDGEEHPGLATRAGSKAYRDQERAWLPTPVGAVANREGA